MAGIYVHIPFCRSKCIYCDFYSMPSRGREGMYVAFVDTLLSEYVERRDLFAGQPVTTLYIGGGTPSSLPPEELGRIIDALSTAETEEITVEVNPDDVTPALVDSLRRHGVNRVSMGIQSFNDEILQRIGRRHTAHDALEAVGRLREGGINNISGDLIFGLPGDSLEGWKESVSRFMELGLPHLSAYLLSYEEGTRLTVMRALGHLTEASEESVTAMYEHLTRAAAEHGYEHYEISNYALPGFHSRHNSSYWDGTPYLGLGPGAHSFDGRRRSFNPPSLRDYLQSNGCRFNVVEELQENDAINDLIITAMRTARGLKLEALDDDEKNRILVAARPFLNCGQLVITPEGRLAIPERFFLVSDSILVELIR